MRILCPIASPGKFFLNLARTEPELPCKRVTLPQTARRRVLCFEFVGEDWHSLTFMLITKTSFVSSNYTNL
uniref:CSON007745 protein n=1 Tax=Culicoides sonorensis TaxID=179676 RepID=A0A336MX28_CULSO